MNIKDLLLQSKRVLLRVDFNVPLDEKQRITDDSRIIAALPTIQYILSKHASLIIMSHLGRPKEKDPKLSLAPIARRLSEILNHPVSMVTDCVGPSVEKRVQNLKPGDILILENLRFHKEEEEPTDEFVKSLAKLGDVYVNDAFGTAHRAHASTAKIAQYFPGRKAAGFLMEKEIKALTPLLHNPERPFYAIIGGAKIATKAGVLKRLLEKVDSLFIGGAMAFPFYQAQGISVGDYPVLESDVKIAKEILEKGKNIYLPIDLVISDGQEIKTIDVKEGIPSGWQGQDIGPKTVGEWSINLKKAKTAFWNGPLGVFEKKEFAKGTKGIAKALTETDAKVIVGGGDTVAAIQQMNLGSCFHHLSTGGGASLEFIEFGSLPGIDALNS